MKIGTELTKIGINKIVFCIYAVFIAAVFLLAYFGMIPRNIKAIPYYDSLGHFVLYGLWALLLDQLLRNKNFVLRGISFPVAIIIMLGIATSEEMLQSASTLRTVSFSDWAWGASGIILFVLFLRAIIHKPM